MPKWNGYHSSFKKENFFFLHDWSNVSTIRSFFLVFTVISWSKGESHEWNIYILCWMLTLSPSIRTAFWNINSSNVILHLIYSPKTDRSIQSWGVNRLKPRWHQILMLSLSFTQQSSDQLHILYNTFITQHPPSKQSCQVTYLLSVSRDRCIATGYDSWVWWERHTCDVQVFQV